MCVERCVLRGCVCVCMFKGILCVFNREFTVLVSMAVTKTDDER